MFVHGIADFYYDFELLKTLYTCDRQTLLICGVGTLVLSSSTSLYLVFKTMIEIERSSSEARDWHARNNIGVACVLLASSVRIESMTILRLKLRGRMIIAFPIEKKHFHFLRYYTGWVHVILAQIPQLLVCMALELCDHAKPCDQAKTVLGNAATSSISIMWTVVSHMASLIVLRATRESRQDRLAADMLPFEAVFARGEGIGFTVT